MTARSVTGPTAARAAPAWFLLALIGIAGMLAYVVLWRGAANAGSFFGGDLVAYLRRRTDSRPPARPTIRCCSWADGQPRRERPSATSTRQSSPNCSSRCAGSHTSRWPSPGRRPRPSASRSCCPWYTPVALHPLHRWRAARDRVRPRVLSAPVRDLQWQRQRLAGGRRRAVADRSSANRRLRGCGGDIRETPRRSLFVAALTDRRSRPAAVILLATVVIVSRALAPMAWSDFVQRAPEHPADRDGGKPDEPVTGARVRRVRALGTGSSLGWILAIGFGIAAVFTGIREGYSNRVLAMAVVSVTFASSTSGTTTSVSWCP